MNFNSIKVRLEHDQPQDKMRRYANFNSIKVRLELNIPISNLCESVFQFHKGTIRTFYLFF